MSVEAIKEAISGLPEDDRMGLAAWLNALTMDDWDAQMQHDFSPGRRGQSLVDQVKAEIRAGRFAKVSERPRRTE